MVRLFLLFCILFAPMFSYAQQRVTGGGVLEILEVEFIKDNLGANWILVK